MSSRTFAIELELTDTQPLSDWFGDNLVAGATSDSIPGAELQVSHVEVGVGFLDSTTTQLILTIGEGVALNLISSALYDWIKSYVRRMQIDGLPVRANPEEIERALQAEHRGDENRKL